MQTPKASGTPQKLSPRSTCKEAGQKNTPKVVRQLKTSPRYSDPTASSSNLATRAPKERSSPLSEQKTTTRVGELESQISQLHKDLKTVKDQLCSSEISKNQAERDAEESNRHLAQLTAMLQEAEKKILERHHSSDSTALTSALDEIQRLKIQLEAEASQTKQSESELQKLKEDLQETLLLVDEMKNQLNNCKKSEAQAQELVGQTLVQLETAKKMVEALRSEGGKVTDAYDAVVFELEQSRARVNFLEEVVSKLNETELASVKLEVEQLRSALEVSEIRYNEEQKRLSEETKSAFKMVEQIKSESGQREAELEAELRKSRYEMEEFRANLMDKENELQGICEENDGLIMQLENTLSGQREHELENEIHKLSEENEALKMEIKKVDENVSGLEDARAAEREAVMKIGYMAEEVEKSKRKVERVTEQLEAAQAANAEMEAELRRLKVQSDQFRKAAEAAAAMLSVGSNGNVMERTGSMDSGYSPRTRRISSPYANDLDEDLMKKKNVNMLRRIGVLWKKQQK